MSIKESIPSLGTLVKLVVGFMIINAIAELVPTLDNFIYRPIGTIKSMMKGKTDI